VDGKRTHARNLLAKLHLTGQADSLASIDVASVETDDGVGFSGHVVGSVEV